MATGKVEPRPKIIGSSQRKVWDEKYKATHNADGTPKGAVAKGRRGGIVDPVFPPLIKDKEAPKTAASSAKGRRGGIVDPVFPPLIKDKEASKTAAPAAKKGGAASFNKAFAEARANGLTTFEFGGKKFNTMQAGESKEDHMAALAKIKEKNQAKLDKLMMEKTGPRKTAPKLDEMAKGGMVKKKKK